MRMMTDAVEPTENLSEPLTSEEDTMERTGLGLDSDLPTERNSCDPNDPEPDMGDCESDVCLTDEDSDDEHSRSSDDDMVVDMAECDFYE
jgi:hypothetical protein